jgi:hypothetical protein
MEQGAEPSALTDHLLDADVSWDLRPAARATRHLSRSRRRRSILLPPAGVEGAKRSSRRSGAASPGSRAWRRFGCISALVFRRPTEVFGHRWITPSRAMKEEDLC